MITDLAEFENKVCSEPEKTPETKKSYEGFRGSLGNSDIETAKHCLNNLSTSRADDYQQWLEVGMCLHSAGCNLSVWDSWSKQSSKYEDGVCFAKWKTFKNNVSGLTIASLIEWARADSPNFELPKKTTVQGKVSSKDDIWENIIPFTELNLPEFPVDCLPLELGNFVSEVAGSLQVAVDMPALLALSNCSYCVSGANYIKAKADWTEPLNLYTAVVMPPASRKSAVMSIITEPLKECEKQIIDRDKHVVQENQSQRRILEKRQEKLERDLAKDNDNSELQEELNKVNTQLANFVDLFSPTILSTDATPEAIARLLFENNGKLGLFSAEGGIFGIMAGRYSSSTPNLDVYLQGHAGDSLKVNRIGRTTEYIEKPALTIGLAIQPTILENLKHKKFMQDCGLLARFLFAMPEQQKGTAHFETKEISTKNKEYYSNLISCLLNVKDRTLTLDPTAKKSFGKYFENFESRLHGDLDSIAFWVGKLRGAVLRIAGIMQLVKDNSAIVVNAETIQSAIIIGNYLIIHAKAVFETMDFDRDLHLAHRILKWVKRHSLIEFSISEVFTALKTSQANSMEDFRQALEKLITHNYLRKGMEKTKGRPAERYYMNPEFEK